MKIGRDDAQIELFNAVIRFQLILTLLFDFALQFHFIANSFRILKFKLILENNSRAMGAGKSAQFTQKYCFRHVCVYNWRNYIHGGRECFAAKSAADIELKLFYCCPF